jgi:uncharacterized membrane protein YagU involved in acid resistance
MNSNHRAMPATKANPVLAIFWAGLLCGTMDIIAAFVVYGAFGLQPLRILKGIAAGLLGSSAFQGGNAIAVLGLACHFTVAFLAAAAFVTVSRYWKFLVDHVAISGPLYGIVVYFFMQLVVIPLSAAHRSSFSLKFTVIGIVIHIFCVGLPIAAVTRRFSAH